MTQATVVSTAFAALLVLGARGLDAQVAKGAVDDRPTIAVMGFTGGSLKNAGDYAALGRGIAELLIVDLAANEHVRVVERQRLSDVLREQELGASGDVDPATVARLGRVLGARHFITGGFLIDTRDHVRIDVRSVDVETSQQEFRETVEGNVRDLFALVERIERKVSDGIKLQHAALADRAGSVQLGGKGDERLALEHLGRATRALEKGDTTAAVAAARDALKAYPDLTPAKNLLTALQKK